jgi:hypothetical protein
VGKAVEGINMSREKDLSKKIEARIMKARKALERIGYTPEVVSAKEFYDYMNGEIFSEDTTTLKDVLGNEFLMVHELSEMSELKKMGRAIDTRVIVDSPKTVIYEAHLKAMELELEYAMFKKDYFMVKVILKQHKDSVLDDDPNLPEKLRPRAEEMFRKFRSLLKQRDNQRIQIQKS